MVYRASGSWSFCMQDEQKSNSKCGHYPKAQTKVST
jgi:hypothetical protein